MTTATLDWYAKFRSIAVLQPANRGNIAAILVVLNRLQNDSALRSHLKDILQGISNEVWRGWAALSLVVTSGEGQIARVTGENVSDILAEFGIAARYIGADGGRSSRGNFRFVRQLLGVLPADRIASQEIVNELRAAQADVINTLVVPELADNRIEISLSSSSRPEAVIAELLRSADLRRAAGGVAQHLVGAKLARRFKPAKIDNFSVFASDRHLQRVGDFRHGHEAFHVTVVAKPLPKLRQRLNDNCENSVAATVLVPRAAIPAYQTVATEFGVRLRPIEEYVGDNLMEMGNHDRERTLQELRDLITTYNERVNAVERPNSGLEIEVRDE